MSDVVAAMRTHLLADANTAAIVATRIYFQQIPQNPTLPAIVLELTGSEIIRHLTATTTLRRDMLNAYCYASTHAAAANLAEKVETALEFKSGTWGTMTIKHSMVEGLVDAVEDPRDGSQGYQFVRSVMAVVWHT